MKTQKFDTLFSKIFLLTILIFSQALSSVELAEVEHFSCGPPGHSLNTSYKPKKEYYANNSSVDYFCKNTDQLLLGVSKRVCRNGIWDQPIPVCGNYSSSIYFFIFLYN